jgi:hypothetical protein
MKVNPLRTNNLVRIKLRTAQYCAKTLRANTVKVLVEVKANRCAINYEKNCAIGVIIPVGITGHVIPIEVEPLKAFGITNLQSLCISCHNAKTQQDNKRYGLAAKKRFHSPFKR